MKLIKDFIERHAYISSAVIVRKTSTLQFTPEALHMLDQLGL